MRPNVRRRGAPSGGRGTKTPLSGDSVLSVLGLIAFLVALVRGSSSGPPPEPTMALADRYNPPWQEDPFVVGIARALVQHETTGCGYFEYRRHRYGRGRYLVRCGFPGESWVYYEVQEAPPGERGRVACVSTPDPSW